MVRPQLNIFLDITTLTFMNYVMSKIVTSNTSSLEYFLFTLIYFDLVQVLGYIRHGLLGQVFGQTALLKVLLRAVLVQPCFLLNLVIERALEIHFVRAQFILQVGWPLGCLDSSLGFGLRYR